MKISVVGELYAMICSCHVKEKCVRPVKNLKDQCILGVTDPTGPETFSVSVEGNLLFF